MIKKYNELVVFQPDKVIVQLMMIMMMMMIVF